MFCHGKYCIGDGNQRLLFWCTGFLIMKSQKMPKYTFSRSDFYFPFVVFIGDMTPQFLVCKSITHQQSRNVHHRFTVSFCETLRSDQKKVDRCLANHSLSSTTSQGTSNIPFPWFLLLGCNSQAQDYEVLIGDLLLGIQ